MRLTIVIGLFALLLSACTGTRSDELASLQQRGTIRIGVKEAGKPFGFMLGGQRSGFDIDIAHAVCQHLGLEPVFVSVTSADRIDRLVAGDVDLVIASMTITRSRDQRIDFSIPYFQDGQGLLVPEDSAINSYLDLDGKRVGCLDGSTGMSNMQQVAPNATLVAYGTSSRMAEALARGEVEAITNDTLYLLGVAKSADNTYRLAGDRFSTEPYGIGLRQNQSALRDAVNEAIQRMWESGEWRLIYDTWFGPGSRYETDIRFAITTYPR